MFGPSGHLAQARLQGADLNLQPHHRILDVGCGDGVITAQLAQCVPDGYVLGIDFQPQAIMQTRIKYPLEKYPNLHFLVADARELKFAEEDFDLVVSRACLHYFAHPGEAFQSIASKLKPGGCMEISCLGKGNALGINKTLQGMSKNPPWNKYFANFSISIGLVDPVSCNPWLEKAGLTRTHARLENELLTFRDQWHFKHWLARNWSNYMNRIPSPQCDAFLNDFLRIYRPSSKAPFKAHIVWLYVGAVKE